MSGVSYDLFYQSNGSLNLLAIAINDERSRNFEVLYCLDINKLNEVSIVISQHFKMHERGAGNEHKGRNTRKSLEADGKFLEMGQLSGIANNWHVFIKLVWLTSRMKLND